MTQQEFKTILFSIALIFISLTVSAQVWQGPVTHNGYSCWTLKTTNNITVYAAKGMSGNQEVLFMKIRVPYRWSDVGRTACVNYYTENQASGAKGTHSTYFDYYNGWMYFIEFLYEWCSGDQRRGSFPCNTYMITMYEKNDHGNNPGNKTIVDIHLNKLNTARMVMNKQSFETHW